MADERMEDDGEWQPKPGAGYCHMCKEELVPGSPADILDHLRVVHPDVYGDGPERWPDGGVVIHAPEVEPGDIGGFKGD